MGMTQAAGTSTPLTLAASAILVAAASNNLMKGVYSYFMSDHKTGIQSASLMTALALAGLAPLIWLAR
jgi:uncharacterized membrane protein (DUF4010 family)